MKNTQDLRENLAVVFKELRSKEIDVQDVKALVATANAMLKSAQLELEHSKFAGIDKKISFLQSK